MARLMLSFAILIALSGNLWSADLAVIVRTDLKMDHPFHKWVVDHVTKETHQAFEPLKPRFYKAGETPQERPETVLMVNHSGHIRVSSRPHVISQSYGIPGQHVIGNVQVTPVGGKKAWQTYWGMKATQDHSVSFEFRHLRGQSYQRGHRWTVAMPKAVMDGKGRQLNDILITIHSQPADGKIDKSPKCPMTNAEAIAVALERTAPRRFRTRIIAGLLNAKLGTFKIPQAHPNAPHLTTHGLKMTLPPGHQITINLSGKPRGIHRFTDDSLAVNDFRIAND